MIANCREIKELAKGGQKQVYSAEHSQIGPVVIKRGEIKSFVSLERIRREVDLLSSLNSVFYPKQYHFNIDVKSKEFEIVEEYIEGRSLREMMNDFTSVKEILKLLQSLTKGLVLIWDKNVVHRDLKPENIIIRHNGEPCIIDLGIARFLDLESLTKTISPVGPCTPIYSSPEQLNNVKNNIDSRTDFFSLGIIAMELYLKINPFDPNCVGNGFSIVENILQGNYACSTNDVSCDETMTEFSDKTLQVQPYRRFRNHQMLKEFIENYL